MTGTEARWGSEPKTVNAVAFERLQELILAGRIAMGERLDERQLAEWLGMSRTPVREAISRLVMLGLVEHRVYKGHFLRSFTAREIAELYEVRKALEGLAARTAAARTTSHQIDALDAIVELGDRALARGDMVEFERADRAFHAAIVEMSENQLLISTLEALALRVQLVRHIANLTPTVAAQSTTDRRAVLKAIAAGNTAAAESAIVQHIATVQEQVLDQFEADGAGGG